jgi:5-methyltetrahydropteroyltriglutamate--homocysteine methyltransferase
MHRPPFRADHIGSLLRPPKLRQAFRAFAAGDLDEAGFIAAQDAAIRNAIRLQQEVGFGVVSDGEFAVARIGAGSSSASKVLE